MSLCYPAVGKFASGAGTATMDLASGGSEAALLEVHSIVGSVTLWIESSFAVTMSPASQTRLLAAASLSLLHILRSPSQRSRAWGRLRSDVSFSPSRAGLMAAMCEGAMSWTWGRCVRHHAWNKDCPWSETSESPSYGRCKRDLIRKTKTQEEAG